MVKFIFKSKANMLSGGAAKAVSSSLLRMLNYIIYMCVFKQ